MKFELYNLSTWKGHEMSKNAQNVKTWIVSIFLFR